MSFRALEEPMNNPNYFSRRRFIGLLWLSGISFTLLRGKVTAKEAGALDKEASWRLGDNLSVAALLYAQDKDTPVEKYLNKAKELAEALGVEIAAFPAKSPGSTSTLADVIHYLIKGDGGHIGAELGKKYGEEDGILFEVSVKSNLLLILYSPGEETGRSISEVIESRCKEIQLPSNLWTALVSAINGQKSEDVVRDAVFKMHNDVATYLSGNS
jgi:hypothetical protein